MKYLFFSILTAFIISTVSITASTQGISGYEIIKRSEEAVRGDSITGRYEITINTRRWTRTMEMTYTEERKNNRSFAEILAPRKDAGNRFLMIDSEMWHFVPDIGQTIKITPSMMFNSWMGSDFSFDDIVNSTSLLDDYTHKLLGTEKINGMEVYKVELTPKPEAPIVWGRLVYYARTADFLPVKQEFYNQRGVLRQTLTSKDFKTMDGRVIPVIYIMQPADSDRYTIMEIKNIRFNRAVPDRVFTLQNLTRR